MCRSSTPATSSGRRSDVAFETVERLLARHERPLLVREVLGSKRALEELLPDDRALASHLLIGVALGDGRLHAALAVRHHDMPVGVLDRARELRGVAVAREDAGRGDAVEPVHLTQDPEEIDLQVPLHLTVHLHDPLEVPAGDDEDVDVRVLLGRRVQLRPPVRVARDHLSGILFPAERAALGEQALAVEDVQPVRTGARQDCALSLGEAGNGKEGLIQDCTCRIG